MLVPFPLPLQSGLPGGPELLVMVVVLALNVVVIAAFLGGVGYFYLRIKSGGSVDERLDRIERKIGGLEAQVDDLNDRLEDRRTD